MHFYFHSRRCKNTVKKYLEQWGMTNLLFSDSLNKKYAKYNSTGTIGPMLGVEIYLLKGVTNHMSPDDDLKVLPNILLHSPQYTPEYKAVIRSCYQDIVVKLRSYKKEIKKINDDRKKRERECIMEDLKFQITMPIENIRDYVKKHYAKPYI